MQVMLLVEKRSAILKISGLCVLRRVLFSSVNVWSGKHYGEIKGEVTGTVTSGNGVQVSESDISA